MTRSTTAGGDHLVRDAPERRNASRSGRAAAAALGGTLLLAGARRRSLGGAAMALAGGWLLYRAVRGRRQSESEGTDASAEHEQTDAGAESGPTTVERSITVGEDADELYRYWRDPELLSRIVGDFAEVGAAGERRHRWSVPTPLGPNIEWEAEILEDRPGEVLRWQSVESSVMSSEGSVRFREAPSGRGTEVTLALRFDPPGGRVGRSAMELLGVVPESLANGMLDRFKSLAETGEIPTLERNPSGRGSGDLM